ncbi:hypothetical protein [Streptomyces sp. NPDC001970]
MTGERSLDLNRITTVRLLTTFSYGSAYRTRDHEMWLEYQPGFPAETGIGRRLAPAGPAR